MRVIHPPLHEPKPDVTANLHVAADNWERSRERAKSQVNWEQWRDRAAEIRRDSVKAMPELIAALEERFRANGTTVHRADSAEEAREIIVDICRGAGAKCVVKGKTMTSEEIALNPALEAAGIETVETDLGEFIVQERGERPSHVLAPAVHLNAKQVADLFEDLSGTEFDPEDTENLVGFARERLREKFLAADVGITGANFMVAETGTLVIVESEGNIRITSSLPRVHIALLGIEKVLRDWDGASHLVQMLPLAAQGKRATASTSFITGPARNGDDGPAEVHVVLLDDGRSAVRESEFWESLACIRCGACLYACPVYRQIGGHSYGSAYSGPIGAVITPALEDLKDDSADLAELSSLCGACSEACPVKIPLDDQLIALRTAGRKRDGKPAEKALFNTWARLWSNPASYRATAKTAGRALGPLAQKLWRSRVGDSSWARKVPFPFSGWTRTREIRLPASRSFRDRWKSERK